jgi:opacity protein-like surface antigen
MEKIDKALGEFVMKKLLCAVIALAALATAPAMSADLEPAVFQHPAPPPVLVPVANWTGCYVGGNAGFGWSNWTYSNASDNPAVPVSAAIYWQMTSLPAVKSAETTRAEVSSLASKGCLIGPR